MNMQPFAETKVRLEEIPGSNGGRITVLRLSGDVSSSSQDALMSAYQTAAKNQPILLDFSKSDYINSSGIALVIQMLIEAGKFGQKVAIFGLTPHFEKVFTMVGIPKYAHLSKDQQAAAVFLG